MNPTLYVKVPQFAYKKANEKGLLNEFLFYCCIKSINIQGYLKRGELVELIKNKTGLSESNIRLKITKLEKLSWLSRCQNSSVKLSKYDVVWKCLDIVKEKGDEQKVFKIQSGTLQQIREGIEIEEIRACLRKQTLTVRASITRKLSEDTERKPSVLSKIIKKILKKMDYSKLFLLQIKNILKKPYNSINFDISLSCLAVSQLFGYKSPMQGYNIEKRLKDSGLLSVTRRVIHLGKGTGKYLPAGYFCTKNGTVMRQLPNMLVVMV